MCNSSHTHPQPATLIYTQPHPATLSHHQLHSSTLSYTTLQPHCESLLQFWSSSHLIKSPHWHWYITKNNYKIKIKIKYSTSTFKSIWHHQPKESPAAVHLRQKFERPRRPRKILNPTFHLLPHLMQPPVLPKCQKLWTQMPICKNPFLMDFTELSRIT